MSFLCMVILFLAKLVGGLLVLLSVAFFTLFERKFMGLIHSRLGPNKVSLFGLLQPILDAVKLLTKVKFTPTESNFWSYNLSPHMSLAIALVIWVTIPSYLGDLSYSLLFFLAIGSTLVVPVLITGWASNSKYSLIGSLRSVAQTISYEAVLTTLLILITVLGLSYSFLSISHFSSLLWLPVMGLWFFCVLAETHRAPFDFAESESELVSGFNTEYGGAYFAFLFLSEYSVLIVSSYGIVYLFLGMVCVSWSGLSFILASILTVLILSLTIWVRVTYVRFRYDLLMMVAWKSLLPVALCLLGMGLLV